MVHGRGLTRSIIDLTLRFDDLDAECVTQHDGRGYPYCNLNMMFVFRRFKVLLRSYNVLLLSLLSATST